MSRLGIIPAGGQAVRFDGIHKELLPCNGDGDTLLDRCIESMTLGRADQTLLISNPQKIAIHAERTAGRGLLYKLGCRDLWKSLFAACQLEYDYYLFAMPDTYYPVEIFDTDFDGDLTVWLFDTDKPERFGVVQDGVIWDKCIHATPGIVHRAYGALAWSRNVVNLWKDQVEHIENHTQAFNLALTHFHPYLKFMDYYHDMESFADHRKLVSDVL